MKWFNDLSHAKTSQILPTLSLIWTLEWSKRVHRSGPCYSVVSFSVQIYVPLKPLKKEFSYEVKAHHKGRKVTAAFLKKIESRTN